MKILTQHSHYSQVLQVCEKLKSAGFVAWLAGGCVRDELLNRLPKDFDVVTDARPDQVEALFEKTIPVGKQFGIVIVVIQGIQIEVATFRSDGRYSDGRHPDTVSFSSPREDAARRDFTINSMFMDPENEVIQDFFGGKNDIQQKLIRTVGDPYQRFNEDKLRILRAIRFAAELNFKIEEQTFKAIFEMAKQINSVSFERQREELGKLLNSRWVSYGLDLLVKSKLYYYFTKRSEEIGNDLILLFNSNQFSEIATLALFWGLNCRAKDFIFNKTTSETSAEGAETLMTLFKYSNYEKNMVTGLYRKSWLLNNSLRPAHIFRLSAEPWSKDLLFFVKSLLSIGVEKPRYFDDFSRAIEAGFKLPTPLITGNDLKDLGIASGPKMKGILDEVMDLQIEGKLPDHQSAINWIKLNIN